MGRISTKEEKSVYQRAREELGLTREQASELTGIEPYKIERIENNKLSKAADPYDVLAMAEAYKDPHICNYYCANECPIGQEFVPETKMKDVSQVVLKLLSAMNTVRGDQERLIDIMEDGEIADDEIADFIKIQADLEKISATVTSLKLWTKKMLLLGKIDKKKYKELKTQLKNI